MAKTRIGVSGRRGSFSEEAGRLYARSHKIKGVHFEFLTSVENVLNALEKDHIDLGVFPIENINGGLVEEALEAMSRHNFKIERQFNMEVHQNFIVKNGLTAARVQRIVSHVQTKLQCERYLQRKWPNVPFLEYADTALAAEDLANGKLPQTTAVIASRRAAKIHGLKVLEPSVHDDKYNFTRFVAARPRR